VATLLDQLLGHANAAAGVGGFTAELTIRYRRPTPYNVPLTIRARTDRVDGRRVHASGEIVADGVVTAEASGLFLMPTGRRLEEVSREYEQRRAGTA
jgi:acyl-CoA thioesterase FadM